MAEPILTLNHVSKSYAGIRALTDISVRIYPGEVHSLVGENGAGKSTLGKIMGGIVVPDEGEIVLDGEPVRFKNPRQALDAGVAVIQQEPSLVQEITVVANVMLGHEVSKGGFTDERAMRQKYREVAARLEFDVPPDTIVETLSIADQQMVEILRALAVDARLLVMDEPTSSLGPEEAALIGNVARDLCAQGHAIVYVSHFLDEVMELSDRITVLRNGQMAGEFLRGKVDQQMLVAAMLGAAAEHELPEKAPPPVDAPVVLRVDSLSGNGVNDVSFEVRKGEVLGIGGLVGSGRTELLRMIFGIDKRDAGRVVVDSTELVKGSPKESMAAGLAFLPEDRAAEGLHLGMSQRFNVTLPHLQNFSRGGFVRGRDERVTVSEILADLDVRPLRVDNEVRSLSGGNQQKVLFGKWLAGRPSVLLLDEPTRGIDIGAKWTIYRLIARLADSGMAVVLVSSEAEEIEAVAHRALVMRKGRVAGELHGSDVTADDIVHVALGVERSVKRGTDGDS